MSERVKLDIDRETSEQLLDFCSDQQKRLKRKVSFNQGIKMLLEHWRSCGD